mmetsp:Transcript_412/g.642  ORF Transcript_412/g.642 Transcript_412/m.642 type:complete len:303 (-) Transcript_412:386-1294(-)|eukprot:CAMPEP_0196185746 /NCGR_PEP_ID=MMETSP0911-20130528/36818_1 /TAXON_ID=49265 /ORGANISM="Thalassiosira rotula, Strain GSO102" /LENGTH=302 /DNA_ID=CAMNT_0041456343 /DNA_START=57 /DNA_END=965 /DNA_ORIENTATION=+
MTRKSVQGGHCAWPDQAGCALTKFGCDDPANFLSSRQIQGAPVNAHGGSCRWQDSVQATLLGRCHDAAGVDLGCAPNIEACTGIWGQPRDIDAWTGPHQQCTISNTHFGQCDYGMCAWAHRDCHEGSTWHAFDAGCTCDQVMVGACSRSLVNGERETFCAVSEDACDHEQSWVAPLEVSGVAGFDCYLCREEYPVGTDTGNSSIEQSITVTENAGFPVIGSNPIQIVAIISIVLGVVLGLSIMGAVGWKICKTKRAMRMVRRAKDKDILPTTTVEIDISRSTQGNRPGIDKSSDEASVLSEE